MPENSPDDPEKTLEQLIEQSRLLRERAAIVARDAAELAQSVEEVRQRLEEKAKADLKDC
jgi:prefoldin subunit 5